MELEYLYLEDFSLLPLPKKEEEEQDEPQRGVIVIDFFNEGSDDT